MFRLQLAIDQIGFARGYSLNLLDHVDPADWFRQPPGSVTHVAWQAGHLAGAEYYLALVRIRGERPEDEDLIPKAFREPFGRQSVPTFDAAKYPTPAEIRTVLDRVHEQTLRELRQLDDRELDRPVAVPKPHPIAKTKLWSLLWCSHHELIHAGQIGLLRRQLGQPPLW